MNDLLLPAALLLMAAVGCNKSSDPSTSPEGKPTVGTTTDPVPTSAGAPAPKPTAIPARASDPTPDPITHPCVVSAAQYKIAIKKGKTDCTTAADCGCYQGGIGRASGCGGVLNKDSLVELSRIEKEFRDDKCKHTQNCAPWACQPKCENGHCVK